VKAPRNIASSRCLDSSCDFLSLMVPPVKLKRVFFQSVTYDPPGCCIYCGSPGDPDLHDEHIIPDAIGGRYRILKASCHECERKTHSVEGRVVSRLYGDSRAFLGMRRGHRRKWPKTFKVHVQPSEPLSIGMGLRLKPHENIDDFELKEIDPADHPSPMVSLNLPPAGLIARTEPDDTNFRATSLNIAMPEDGLERLKRIGPGRVLLGGAGRLPHDDFGRFLAKIAHSFAVAYLGIGTFIPFLTRAIRNQRPMYLSHYVGGAMANTPVEPTDHLHTLQAGILQFDSGERFVQTRVRLFAVDQFPVYDVIVGTATEATPPLSR
jgi:hypothetical protein